jgi:ubiquinone/menaquinone biosynthesis C-methylase UbiE
MSQNYVDVIYNTNKKPLSFSYPRKLIHFLIKKFNLKKKQKILEPGVGRAEFLYQFKQEDFDCYAFDNVIFKNHFNNFDVKFQIFDCLKEKKFPYSDNYFDIIYSKSFIEHFYHPENLFKEFNRILKPGGKIITLTPDWETVYKSFYEDYTHRTPFTTDSLHSIHEINNFQNISVKKFTQLPSTWESDFMYFLSFLTKKMCPDFMKKKLKWVKFSKETMILSYAEKKI